MSESGPSPHERDDDLPEQADEDLPEPADSDASTRRVDEELDEYERWLELRRQQRGR